MKLQEKIAQEMHKQNLSPRLGKDKRDWKDIEEWKKVHFRTEADRILKILKAISGK